MQKNKKIFKIKIIYLLPIILFFLVAFIQLIINFLFIPKEINIIAGNKHKMEFNLPIVATVASEDIAVFNEDNQVIKNKLNLNKVCYIESETEGESQLKLSVMGIPIKKINVSVLPQTYVIPGGESIGVRINTDGVMVLGIGDVKTIDKKTYAPSDDVFKAGDLIIKANNKSINNKQDLIDIIEKTNENEEIVFEVKRDEEIINLNVKPVKGEDGLNKIGVWVRDSTQGIGTLTYFNPTTQNFAALGHGILDVDTKEIMTVKDGEINLSNIIGVKKGEKGKPGELVGDYYNNDELGEVLKNTNVGIYGKITDDSTFSKIEPIPIGTREQVEIGPAKIRCTIDDSDIQEYDIYIENVNKYSTDSSKSMIIRITDPRLIKKTNGIVQGMSGSPIIQNNKLIGAVTHVFVQQPDKGYGIFIENMIKEEDF